MRPVQPGPSDEGDSIEESVRLPTPFLVRSVNERHPVPLDFYAGQYWRCAV